jgi:protein neuralized
MGAQNSVFETNTANDYQVTEDNYYNNFKSQNDNSLKFHEISGLNVTFDSLHTKADRIDGFCNSIVLSNRQLRVNEVVFIRFSNVSDCWRGSLRFGLTCKDPDLNEKDITSARYVCPDLTNKDGYWARALNDDDIKENDILYFYINKDGNVYYGINNVFRGLFFEDFKVSVKVWAIFDIYGNTTSIELIGKLFFLVYYYWFNLFFIC